MLETLSYANTFFLIPRRKWWQKILSTIKYYRFRRTNLTGKTVSANTGGFELENINSIRFNAPRFNSGKGRVVTSTDYETTIKQSNPNIKSVTVWGGEDNVTPVYGKVYISLQPQTGFVITDTEKNTITNNVIKPKLPVSLVTEFVDSENLYS